MNHIPSPFDAVPHNIEAEQALLGAILLNNSAIVLISDILAPEMFFEPLHGEIFRAILDLNRAGRAVTPIVLSSHIPNREIAKDLNVLGYLGRLVGEATTVINAPDYARVVAETYQRRLIIGVGQELEAMACRKGEEEMPPPAIIEAGMSSLLRAYGSGGGDTMRSASSAMTSLMTRIQGAWNGEKPIGVATGMPMIDEQTGPLAGGDLIVLGGESSMGKTALGLQIAYNLAAQGLPGLIFSLEMSSDGLLVRPTSWLSKISASRIENASDLNQEEFERVVEAASKLESMPWHIDDSGKLSVNQIATRARRAKQAYGIRWGLVDHLQFIRGDRRRGKDSKFDVIGEAVDDLKALAKELDIPILLLSQLRRDIDLPTKFRSMSDVPRPHMARLYGASEIEKAADKVLFVHRPSYFLERMSAANESSEGALSEARVKWQGRAEIILAKRRQGPAPSRRLCRYIDHLMWFAPLHDEPDAGELVF